jgi:hypothetical protein
MTSLGREFLGSNDLAFKDAKKQTTQITCEKEAIRLSIASLLLSNGASVTRALGVCEVR